MPSREAASRTPGPSSARTAPGAGRRRWPSQRRWWRHRAAPRPRGGGAGAPPAPPPPDVPLPGPPPPASNPKGTPAIRVENIRELERLASLKPAEAPWKVFIVDEAETMTGAGPQAFLKTLEGPPARTVIILVLRQARA